MLCNYSCLGKLFALFGLYWVMETDRRQLLAQVAFWYYVDGDSLATIAQRINRSVSRASRLLQEARDENLVDIRIRFALHDDSTLARAIEKRFELTHATVFIGTVDSTSSSSLDQFGSRAAMAIDSHLDAAKTIATGWGAHVHAVINAVTPRLLCDGVVVQACGSIGATDSSMDGARLAHMLADQLGMQSRTLHAPLLLDNASVAKALRTSPSIKQTLKVAQSADMTLMGLGSLDIARSGMHKAGFVTRKELQNLKKEGSVGDLGGYHLSANGSLLKHAFNERVIGLTPSQLKRMPGVVVIATGLEKTDILQAALKGGYINHLITDQASAQAVLESIATR